MSTLPWTEKYRPKLFNNIIMDDIIKDTLINSIKTKCVPNLLVYGPPGTGKTTTIINYIKLYQHEYKQEFNELVIHLNASHDRGIETIRNEIHTFVNSSTMFNKGVKFIILDEIDYMTEPGQITLKNIIIKYRSENIKFFVICNYISKVIQCLQDEFIILKICTLNKYDIENLLNTIIKKENINIPKCKIKNLINIYNYDIRSMINELQNHVSLYKDINLHVIKQFINSIKKDHLTVIIKKMNKTLFIYNSSKYEYIINIFKYLLKYNSFTNDNLANFLNFTEIIIHMNIYEYDLFDEYFILSIKEFI